MLRNTFMKVAIFSIALTVSASAIAQEQGDMAAGGNMVLGVGGDHTHFGIGGKFLYNLTDPIRLAGEFDFFPKTDDFTWWDISVYGHYIFPLIEKISVYPLVGIGIIGIQWSYDYGILGKHSESINGFVFSPGGGVEFKLLPNLALNAEVRFKFIKFSDDDDVSGRRTNFVVGLAYKF